MRQPDVYMGVRAAGFGEQIGQILKRSEALFLEHRPDRSARSWAIPTADWRRSSRGGSEYPVYHMEAGNRCYDDRVPEEVNRRVIDHSSSVLMPYTNRSRENLIAEGFPGNRVYVIGNPIKQVID